MQLIWQLIWPTAIFAVVFAVFAARFNTITKDTKDNLAIKNKISPKSN